MILRILFVALMVASASREQSRPIAPPYDPELREVNDRLMALEQAIGRFSREHGNIMADQGRANADLASSKAKIEAIAKQLDDIIASGTPIEGRSIAILETKINLVLWFFGTSAAALIALEIARVFAAAAFKDKSHGSHHG